MVVVSASAMVVSALPMVVSALPVVVLRRQWCSWLVEEAE